MPPPGCRFNTRCPLADDICRTEEPVLRDIGGGHFVACHHPLETPVEVRQSVDAAPVPV